MCENFFTPESSLTRTAEISPQLTRGLRVPLKRSLGRNPLLFLSKDYDSVKIATPFDNFKSVPVPETLDEYLLYLDFTEGLIKARNKTIEKLYLSN